MQCGVTSEYDIQNKRQVVTNCDKREDAEAEAESSAVGQGREVSN